MNIAIIGGGIVGMTAAYYLSKTHQVSVYDDGLNQATSASAGIICPWLSQRRNKDWYRLTANGAAFYKTLCNDLTQDGIPVDFYRQNGALYFKKTDALLSKLEQLAHERLPHDPTIGEVTKLSPQQIRQIVPELQTEQNGLLVSGGAMIDGRLYLNTLQHAAEKNGCIIHHQRVQLKDVQSFDAVIIAAGAYTKELLEAIGYTVDITPQKGQLFTVKLNNTNNAHYPVIIPQSEFDLLPTQQGEWVIGATHEKNKGFDNQVDFTLLNDMKTKAAQWMSELHNTPIVTTRVGTRAFTSDYLPCFGQLKHNTPLYVASGLGSSGLTNGPYIAYLLSLLINQQPLPLDITPFSPDRYIKHT